MASTSENIFLKVFKVIWKKLLAFHRHPLAILFWFVFLSLRIKENYPISHFPMYSSLDERHTTYYYLLDEKKEPIPCLRIFNISIPKVKKTFKAERSAYTRTHQLKTENLTDKDRQKIGQSTLAKVRSMGLKKRHPSVPQKLTLVRVDIDYRDGKFIKSEKIIATEP